MSRPADHQRWDAVLAEVAAAGAADAGGLPVELLGDFLVVLSQAVHDRAPLTSRQLRAYRTVGDRAAQQGVALRALLDLYLSSVWRLWRRLPAVESARDDPDRVVSAGEVMLHAADDVVAALTEGYQLARRTLVRAQESARREFIDDLLSGTTDVVGLLRRADGFGLDLSGPHAVATIVAERPFDDGSPVIRRLERAISGVKGDAHALLASKAGRLAVVFAAPDQAAVAQVSEQLAATLRRAERSGEAIGAWQVAIGASGVGVDGVATSYRDSLDTLALADRLGIDDAVIDSRDLGVYQVLLRDRAALRSLVESRLDPLTRARGGAQPLLDTLEAYFRTGGNAARSARDLHLSVRATTYRLERVRDLTGLSVDRPEDRFTLQVATLGARLLGWPTA